MPVAFAITQPRTTTPYSLPRQMLRSCSVSADVVIFFESSIFMGQQQPGSSSPWRNGTRLLFWMPRLGDWIPFAAVELFILHLPTLIKGLINLSCMYVWTGLVPPCIMPGTGAIRP